MISIFQCQENDQRLTILEYEENKTNGRYRAVINEDKIAVLHLQSVNIKDTSVSKLSLCPGVLESEVLNLLSKSPVSSSLACSLFIIEKVEDRFMFR